MRLPSGDQRGRRIRPAFMSEHDGRSTVNRNNVNLCRLRVIRQIDCLNSEDYGSSVRRQLRIVDALETHQGVEGKWSFTESCRDA